ncbi:MAG: hypothetical protein ACRD3T_21390 [Terriglobia bacterium]
MKDLVGKPVRVLVVWEPVLPTDWGPPSTATLDRIPDARAIQFWDRKRLTSHLLVERHRNGILWDYIAVYLPGGLWTQQPPKPLYSGGPVVWAIGPAKSAITEALEKN